MKLSLTRVATAALLAGGSVAAHADDVSFSGFAVPGTPAVTITVGTAPPPILSEGAYAGGINTTLNGGPSFVSFCIDFYHNIAVPGGPYGGYTDETIGAFNAVKPFTNPNAQTDLAKLFTLEGDALTSATKSAAFQVAVWEVAYEAVGTYSVTGGHVTFIGDSAVMNQATTYLGDIATITGSVNLRVLAGGPDPRTGYVAQDMIHAVPEPDTYALMAAGLAAVGFVARRRARQG